jgi:hypothetical protein
MTIKSGDMVRGGGLLATVVCVKEGAMGLLAFVQYQYGYSTWVKVDSLTPDANDVPQNMPGESWEVFCPRTSYTVAMCGTEATAIAICDNYPNLDYSRTGF